MEESITENEGQKSFRSPPRRRRSTFFERRESFDVIMEESITENEGQKSFRSPPRRRRSTFFERRESFVPQTLSENVDPSTYKTSTEIDDKHSQDLSRYHDKLLSEKEQWKKEVTNRRNKYHDLRQQYQMAVKARGRSRISYAALSKEDIEFINAKANISKLVDSQLKLHKSVKETRALFRRASELDNVILQHCEDRVNKITEYIFEHSTVEPMDE